MTANYVARETGWDMHGWGHGDRATNDYFAPLETYGPRLDELLEPLSELARAAPRLTDRSTSRTWRR